MDKTESLCTKLYNFPTALLLICGDATCARKLVELGYRSRLPSATRHWTDGYLASVCAPVYKRRLTESTPRFGMSRIRPPIGQVLFARKPHVVALSCRLPDRFGPKLFQRRVYRLSPNEIDCHLCLASAVVAARPRYSKPLPRSTNHIAILQIFPPAYPNAACPTC